MADSPLLPILRKRLETRELSFREFMEIALYEPAAGYYGRASDPIGFGADYVTSSRLSPAFGHALARLVAEFLRRADDASSTVVDIGCGDGSLITQIFDQLPPEVREHASFFGVDQSLARVPAARQQSPVRFVTSLRELPSTGPMLVLSYELFDARPSARLVRREDGLHELTVRLGADGQLDWGERAAPAEYVRYFEEHGVTLQDGQFADVSLEWAVLYRDICSIVDRGLVVTFDYGYEAARLFNARARRWGTAAAYREHRASRDLLAAPGEQDLTAHINFDDLRRTGEQLGFDTLLFDSQSMFLLSLGVMTHPDLQPDEDGSLSASPEALAAREAARALILPDGPGTNIRVLVQSKGFPRDAWHFARGPRQTGGS